MKIKSINIKDYGCIAKKDIEFRDGISVIKGNNESGKSTIQQAMLALMFGFLNSDRKKTFKLSPKAEPFAGGFPEISGSYVNGFDEYTVLRYFQGHIPKASVAIGGTIKEFTNEPLEILSGISRETFEGIYSLDIDKIASLKENWKREQDSILAGLYTDFLLPNDKIEEKIDRKVKEAWKGKILTKLTKAKEIEEAISAENRLLLQARTQQQNLRQMEIEGEDIEIKLASCDTEISKLEMAGIEFKRQLDFYNEFAQIYSILAETSQAAKYNQVPKDTKKHLENLANEITSKKQKKSEIKKRLIELEETINHYRNENKNLVLYKELVPKAENIAVVLVGEKSSIIKGLERENAKKNQIEVRRKRIFKKEFVWDDFNELMKIDIADCFALLDNLQSINEEKTEASQIALESKLLDQRGMLGRFSAFNFLMFAIGIVGTLMIFLPVGTEKSISIISGTLLLAITMVASIFKKIKRKNTMHTANIMTDVRKLDQQYESTMARLRKKFQYDFIPIEKRKQPDKFLIESVAQLQSDYSEYLYMKEEVEKDRAESGIKENEINRIAKIVIGEGIRQESAITHMRRKLNDLLELETDAISSNKEVIMLNKQLAELKGKLIVREKELQSIDNALQTIDAKSIIEKAEKLECIREEHHAAKSREDVLKRKYKDFDILTKKIESNVDIKIFETTKNIENIAKTLIEKRKEQNELSTQKGEIKTKSDIIKKSSSAPAVIKGEIDDLRQEKQRRIKLRDEYVLCYGLIQKAREKFISDFRPEFIDKASEYLSIITDGKYTKIRLRENGTSIVVMNDLPRTFDFESIDTNISRGTKEQIYLAIRLAMLERFDPKGNKLPIILDEALVNWDIIRFRKLIKIINEVAKERQIFIFTCHDYVADVVSEASDGFKLINI